MKTIAIAGLVCSLMIGTAFAQDAAPSAQPGKSTRASGNVCLSTYMIDHTNVTNPSTIVFYMKNGKAWKNTLLTRCPGLKFDGFAYVTRDGQICSNMQSIIVLRTHEVCMLGAFEPYTPPKKMPTSDKH